jgi:gamma-glutamyltranspeptidase/glutathione hydrolase
MKLLPLMLLLPLFFIISPVQAKNKQAAVASAHPLATEAGLKILKQGGNAFDAAVTVSSVLAVVEPYSSGIGGGGFWLLHRASDGYEAMLDGREKAPLAATHDMYLDENGEVIKGASINGAKATGIPGEPAALVWLAEEMGNLPLSQSLQPAIKLAEDGFPVDQIYYDMMQFRYDAILESEDASRIFLDGNEIPEIGTIIKQEDLASTLKLLAEKGKQGFYAGEVAKKLVDGVREAGGIWTLDDLKKYEVAIREPIIAQYKDMKITSASLPSSGGIVLAEIFNMLSHYNLEMIKPEQRIHLITEAMRRAYRDRAEYLGDSDQVAVPVSRLINPDYAFGLKQSISLNESTASKDLSPTYHSPDRGNDTTHFSIIDKEGNRVAATLSINYPFGSCFVPPGTGVLLNDEMDDFSIKPGEPNVYGLVGNQANAIAPGKRMLSSMSPTFLETPERLAAIGSPGGSRIITMVLLGALAFEEDKNAEEIVNLPRFHHQYLPDAIQLEPEALSEDSKKQLTAMGHELDQKENTWGNMHIVIQDKQTGKLTAASDKRGIGSSQVIE